jgi:hypothetical protein
MSLGIERHAHGCRAWCSTCDDLQNGRLNRFRTELCEHFMQRPGVIGRRFAALNQLSEQLFGGRTLRD